MSTPTLINLPPPPSDPVTPSDLGPGTPGSGTTSLSALSTTAIKDGHRGHALPHTHAHTSSSTSRSSTNTLDAERADRISRLAGLERVATGRGATTHVVAGAQAYTQQQPPGYFDQAGTQQARERSTVGSASATGSLGGGTTWASGSDMYDADKMSEDPDDGVSSTGLSEEGDASLVGFGEGASSTISGPVSSSERAFAGFKTSSGIGSPAAPNPSKADNGSFMHGLREGDYNMSDENPFNGAAVDHPPKFASKGPRDASMSGLPRGDKTVGAKKAGQKGLASPAEGNGLG